MLPLSIIRGGTELKYKERKERIKVLNDGIIKAYSYNEIKTKNLRIPMINTSVIDPPATENSTKFLMIVQQKTGKPSDNLLRAVNNFIKTKKPIYILQFNDDFLKYFNDFEPKRVDYYEPIEEKINGDIIYQPDQDFFDSYMKTLNDDCLEYYRSVKK